MQSAAPRAATAALAEDVMSGTMWTRKRTVIGGESSADDWIVRRNGEDVGRVRLDFHPYNDASPWMWASWVLPATHGRADSMENALEAVRSAVTQQYSKP